MKPGLDKLRTIYILGFPHLKPVSYTHL